MGAMRSPGWLAAMACSALATQAGATDRATPMAIASSAFAKGGELPSRFTCEGAGVSPPLAWQGVPSKAKSLALVVSDPDAPDPAAPKRTWTHWIVYDLPATSAGVPEAMGNALPAGARQGNNDWGRAGYGGACPPIGRHRYIHVLYALDVALGDLHAPDRQALERAMKGHVLAQAQLVGTYAKHAVR